MPGTSGRRDLKIRNIFDASQPAQTVPDDFRLRIQLGLVVHLLKVTTAATAKIWTGRLDAIRRWGNYLLDYRERNVPFHSIDANSQTISRGGQRHHDRAALSMGQSKSARQNSFNCDFHVQKL